MIRAGLPGRPTTDLRRRLAVKRELQELAQAPMRRYFRVTFDQAIETAVERARLTGRRQRVERVHGGYQVQEVSA